MVDEVKGLLSEPRDYDCADINCTIVSWSRRAAAALQNQAKEIERLTQSLNMSHEIELRQRISELEAKLSTLERETVQRCEQAIRVAPSLDENGYIVEKSKAIEAIRALIPSDKGEASLTKETANERPRQGR